MFSESYVGGMRVASHLQGNTWGLVLSGGGGKGAYQVGAMKAILEAGAKITAVSGTSVGALNAALLATYDIDSIIQIWQGIRPEIALSQEELEKLIWANAIPHLMERSDMLCYVSAYNIFTGKTDYFCLNDYHGEEIVKLMLASAAIPIVYPPVPFRGTLYWDGGILDYMPIEVLCRRGYRNLITISLNPESQQGVCEGANVVAFEPSKQWGFLDGTLNFNPEDIRERIEMGYRETKRALSISEKKVAF